MLKTTKTKLEAKSSITVAKRQKKWSQSAEVDIKEQFL